MTLTNSWRDYCHTGRHTEHLTIPWFYNKPYDKICDVCGHSASSTCGKDIPICDCCSQDWNCWLQLFGRRDKIGYPTEWLAEFKKFKGFLRKLYDM